MTIIWPFFLAFRKKKILTLILRPATGRSWLPIPSQVTPKNYKNGTRFCVPTPTASCSLTLCVWHRQCVSACAPRGQSASLHPGHTGLYVDPAAHPSLMRFPPSWLMWNSSPAVEGDYNPPNPSPTPCRWAARSFRKTNTKGFPPPARLVLSCLRRNPPLYRFTDDRQEKKLENWLL